MTVQTRQPKFFPKQSGNKIAKGAQAGDFQKINSGAVKTIYAKIVANQEGALEVDSTRVLYMSNTLLGRMELNEEVEKADEIRKILKKKIGTAESHIQTDLVRKGEAVEAPKAIGDLDDYIKKSNLSLSDRIDIAYQVVLGMQNMQKAGYVTGDAKLENILVFREKGRIIVRISDFGKARELAENGISYVNGNPRFTSPEGVLSYKGEVFSTALMILRILEESLDPALCRKLTVAIKKGASTIERRGVEGLLLRNGRKNKKGIAGQLGYLGRYAIDKMTSILSLKQAKQEENILHRHIDALCNRYFTKSFADTPKNRTVLHLFALLKDMTRADPNKRPSMEEVQSRYKKSFTRSQTVAASKRKPTRARHKAFDASKPRPIRTPQLMRTRSLPT